MFLTGYRLHDLQVNVGDNEQENSCGFFKGPASEGDQIVVYCASGSLGTYVLLKILSQPGKIDFFHVCEVQVIGDFKQWNVLVYLYIYMLRHKLLSKERHVLISMNNFYVYYIKDGWRKKSKHVFWFNCTFEVQMHQLLILF